MYDWFNTLIGAPATGANEFIVACCGVVCILSICIAVKAVFWVIDYMIGGRKK